MKRFPFISRFAASVAMVAMALGTTCIVSCSDDNNTDPSPAVKQLDTPAEPTAGLATESDLSFTWKAVSGAKNYAAQVRLDKYGDVIRETITERLGATFTELENGTEYFFRVRANDANNERKNSAWTEWISSKTVAVDPQYKPLDAPKNPICDMTMTTASSLTFQWEVVENAATYTWQVTATDQEPVSGITDNLTVTIPALVSGVSYTFVVKANPAEGAAFRSSSYSKGVKASTVATLATPAELKNTLKMAEALSFSWAAVDYAESYSYELTEGGVPVVTGVTGKHAAVTRAEGDVTTETTNTSVSFMNLKKSTYYQFRVKALPAEGSMIYAESAYTDYVIVKTLATDATPLAAPVLSTKDINQVRGTVAWTAVSGAASYKYQWGATQAEAEASTPVEIVAVDGVLPVEFTKTGLTPEMTYYTRVMACPDPADAAKGDSEYSPWKTLATPAKVNALTISTADELIEVFDRVNAGAVVTLKAGNYLTNKIFILDMAISLVGESATNRPVVNMKQFTMAPAAACALIKLQNIEFSCYALDADGNITPGAYLGGYFIDNSGQAADVESLVIDNCVVANGFMSAFLRLNRVSFGVKNMTVTNNIVSVGGNDGGIIGANGKTHNVASWVIRNNTFDGIGSVYGATKTAQLIRCPTPADAAGFTLTIENNTFYKGSFIKGKNLLEAAGGGNVVLKKNIIVVDPAITWTSNIGVTNNLTSENNFICNTTSTLTGFTTVDPQITGYQFLTNYKPTEASVIAAGAGDGRWLK